MACAGAASAAPPCQIWRFRPKLCILERCPIQLLLLSTQIHPKLRAEAPSATTFSSSSFHPVHGKKAWPSVTPKASVGSVEYVVEPETNVKFEKDLIVSGCSGSMVLLGTGYREKVFAIIGVKVYAAGFYVNPSLQKGLSSWKGKSSADILEDSSLFKSIFQEPAEKSLKISLVRDVDGDTFWNALNDVISPRIKEPTSTDDSALSILCNTFQGRPLKKGTVILLTWAEPSKMLVSIPLEGPPSTVDAVIESINVTASLFDAFFGESPVSPTLKASVANGLGTFLSSS